MKRLTSERCSGIKTGYWSPAKKDELIQRLGKYEDTGLEPEEIRPVVHAHWIPLEDLDLCECSRCGRREIHYYGCEESAAPEEAYPYCHCGAKMDQEGPHGID